MEKVRCEAVSLMSRFTDSGTMGEGGSGPFLHRLGSTQQKLSLPGSDTNKGPYGPEQSRPPPGVGTAARGQGLSSLQGGPTALLLDAPRGSLRLGDTSSLVERIFCVLGLLAGACRAEAASRAPLLPAGDEVDEAGLAGSDSGRLCAPQQVLLGLGIRSWVIA